MSDKFMAEERMINLKSSGYRSGDIDILRAIGIITMLLGHVGLGELFEIYISSFHMPLFYILSGFLFNRKRGIIETVKHSSKKLLIPYAFWGILYEGLWMMRGNKFGGGYYMA